MERSTPYGTIDFVPGTVVPTHAASLVRRCRVLLVSRNGPADNWRPAVV